MKYSIYIVDDSEIMRAFLENICRKHAYVSLFNNGESLLNELDSGGCPDIIILDLNLPGIQGKDILRFLNTKYSHLSSKVYIVSGIDNSEERIACLALGATDFIVKPFHPLELEYKIESGLFAITQKV